MAEPSGGNGNGPPRPTILITLGPNGPRRVPLAVALLLLALVFAPRNSAWAQTATAFLEGEETTGMTKQCFYNALGNGYTVTINSIRLCPLTIQVRANPTRSPRTDSIPQPEQPRMVTAFQTGERTTGMTKQCFYEALGSAYTRTISAVALCPLSIRVRLWAGP